MTFIQSTDKIFTPSKINGEENNRTLKATLSALINKAKHNEKSQAKFHNLELHFLRASSLSTLYTRLLIELNERFDLELVELILVDKNNEMQMLITDIYGELNFENLSYISHPKSIEPLYSEDSKEHAKKYNKGYDKEYQVILTQDKTDIEKIFTFTDKCPKSAVMLPLTKNGELIGSLHLGSHNDERFTPGLATSFLTHLAAVVSICIENAITQEQFKLLSLVDLLTRTKNRRYFVQSITREIARASRSSSSLSCLFLDLDHFKLVNDTHGHLTGDRALQAVANAIKPLLRQSDVLSRFGGEEFTVMLPETDQYHAQEIAERIRKSIAQIIIQDDHKKEFKITVSIGISTWSPNHSERMSFEEVQTHLIKKADEGVYLAKESGRNCVKIAV